MLSDLKVVSNNDQHEEVFGREGFFRQKKNKTSEMRKNSFPIIVNMAYFTVLNIGVTIM